MVRNLARIFSFARVLGSFGRQSNASTWLQQIIKETYNVDALLQKRHMNCKRGCCLGRQQSEPSSITRDFVCTFCDVYVNGMYKETYNVDALLQKRHMNCKRGCCLGRQQCMFCDVYVDGMSMVLLVRCPCSVMCVCG